MKTPWVKRRWLVLAGILAASVAGAIHPYGPVSQTGGGLLRLLGQHPILGVVVHLWLAGIALCVGAVILAALVRNRSG
jgi:hypothetical protein